MDLDLQIVDMAGARWALTNPENFFARRHNRFSQNFHTIVSTPS